MYRQIVVLGSAADEVAAPEKSGMLERRQRVGEALWTDRRWAHNVTDGRSERPGRSLGCCWG